VSNEKKLQNQIDTLMNALGVLLTEFKNKEETDNITGEIVRNALDANILYCRFVSEYYDIEVEELSAAFDEWVVRLSDEELAEMCRSDAPSNDDSKINAETPKKLYTMNEIMSPFNNLPEEGATE
jgi:hypothetical protein